MFFRLKLGHFTKYIRNNLEDLKCGAWTDRVKNKEIFTQSQGRKKQPTYNKKKEG
jgi:hypothetical protein